MEHKNFLLQEEVLWLVSQLKDQTIKEVDLKEAESNKQVTKSFAEAVKQTEEVLVIEPRNLQDNAVTKTEV